MLEIITPQTEKEIIKQISALEYAIKTDTCEKDRNIHKAALKKLKVSLEGMKK